MRLATRTGHLSELRETLAWYRKQEAKWTTGANDPAFSERARFICAKHAEGYRSNIEQIEKKLAGG